MSNNYAAEQPSSEAMERATATVTADLRPVRRLPSDRVLITVAMLVFVLFSLAVAFALGLAGFQQLTATQKWIYYGAVLGCASLLSAAVVPQMIPGSKRHIGTAVALSLSLAVMAVCTIAIFPCGDFDRFVPFGWPCLRVGLFCAAASGLLAFFLLRPGYFVSPLQAYVLSGMLAGFTGVAALALHCPQQNWLHVLVWHLGAPVLSGMAVLLWWQVRFLFRRA